MDQQQVSRFIAENGIESPPAYRLLDLVSEVGELATDAAESTDYGQSPEELTIKSDEIGDVLFSLLALAEGLDMDAGAALDEALDKYQRRIDESDRPASGK